MAAVMTRQQRIGLALVVSILFVDELLYSLIIPIIPYFMDHLHVSPTMTGVLFSSYAVGSLVAAPFFGRLTDRTGRRLPILAGLAFLVMSTLLFAFSHSIGLLIASRTIQGISAGATWTAGLTLLVDLFPPKTRGKAMGLAFTGISAGTLLGAPFGGLIFEIGGYESPFLVAAALALLNILLVLLFLPETSWETQTNKASVWSLFRIPAVWFISFAILLASTTLCLLDPVLPILLNEQFNLNSAMIGLLFGAMTLAYAIMSPVSGTLSDQYGPRHVILISLVGMAGSLLAVAFSQALWHVAAAMIFSGLFIGSTLSPAMAYLGDAVDNSRSGAYGAAYALSNMIFMVGMIVGPLFGGMLTDSWSVTTTLHSLGIVIFLFVIVAGVNMYRAKNRPTKKTRDGG